MRRVSCLFVILMAGLFGAGNTSAQGRSGPLPPPEEILKTLQSEDKEAKQSLGAKLALEDNYWTRGGKKAGICTEHESIKLDHVVLKAPSSQAVLQVDSCGYFIVVLEKDSLSKWSHVGTVALYPGQWKPQISFMSLIQPGEQEIVVRGYVTDTGSGFFQSNLMILKEFEGRIETVFLEAEKMNFAVPKIIHRQPGNTDQEQESTFTFEKARREARSVMGIVEKQDVRDHEKHIFRWREFQWVPELRRFVPNNTDR